MLLPVALLGYSQVIFTSFISIALWHDILTWSSWIGMLLIITAGAAAMLIAQRQPVPRQQMTAQVAGLAAGASQAALTAAHSS